MNAKLMSLIAGAALLQMCSNGTALATTFPAYSFNNGSLCAGANFQSCTSGNSVNFPANTQYSYTSPTNSTQPGTATATGSATVSSATSPSMSFTATASGDARAIAGSQFTYYIELTGPFSGEVPDFTVNTQGSAGLNGQAYVIITPIATDTVPFPTSIYLAQAGGTCGGICVYDSGAYLELNTPGTSFNRSDTVAAIMEGVVYSVTLDADADTGNSAAYPTTTASIDPYFTYPSNYSLLISSGVGNAPASSTPSTPLPAALPLFATGLGALGLFGWRRKGAGMA